MAHIGTLNIHIVLDAAALKDNDEYKTLSLMASGYAKRTDLKRFQLVRQVDHKDGGAPIDVIVDFLIPRDVKLKKNKPVLIDNFAVQRGFQGIGQLPLLKNLSYRRVHAVATATVCAH